MKHLKFFIFLCILTFTVSCGQQKRYIQYKVKNGETLSAIADKLHMNKKDLIRLNPDVETEPKANSFIVVPENKLNNFKNKIKENPEVVTDSLSNKDIILTEEEKLLEELKEKYVLYEVQKGDTFYSFKKNFGVTRGELLLLNPELKEGVKVGQVLKIKEIPVTYTTTTDDDFYNDFIKPNVNLKVALLLPFRAGNYHDTIKGRDIFTENATLVNIATDFYLGAELAIDSLRRRGIDIQFNVFDTGNRRDNGIKTIIAEQDLNQNDAIIGPLYSEEVEMVARSVNVPVVFPVYSNNQSSFQSSNIIKTSPEKSIFREELERFVKDSLVGNVIIVSDTKTKNIQTSRLLKSSLQEADSINSIHVLTPVEGYIKKARFLEILQPNTNNWVILATDNNVIVADAINSLISLPEEITAKVFTFDKGKVYDKIDNRKLAKVGFTYVSDEFVDENSLNSRVFENQYMRKNKALPSFYATKGFDITYDILVRLASGNDLDSTFKEGASSRVESKFDYRNNHSENEGLFIVQYNADLSLTKLK